MSFAALIGRSILDMHDFQGGMVIVDYERYYLVKNSRQDIECSCGAEIIESYTGLPYREKQLVVIEDFGGDTIRAAYSWDGRRFGVMTFQRSVP